MKQKLLQFLDFYPSLVLSLFSFFFFLFPAFNKFDRAGNIWFLILFAVFVLDFAVVAFFRRFLNGKFHIEDNVNIYQKVFLGAFLLFYLISFFKSQTYNFGYTEVLMTFLGALIFLHFTQPLTAHRSPPFLYVFSIFILILNSVFGYYMYIFSHHNRAFGFFYDPLIKAAAWPNAFALFILILWPLMLHFLNRIIFLHRRDMPWHISTGGILIFSSLIFSTFILTFSRAAYIAFFGQTFLFLIYGVFSIYKNKIKKEEIFKKLLTCFCVIILTISLVFLAQNLRSHYQNKINTFTEKINFENGEKQTSIKERADFMKGAVVLSKDEPLFGYGPMSFGYVYRSIQKDWLFVADHPHNMFLKIMVENGIPAMIFFILFLLSVLIPAFKDFINSKEKNKFFTLCLLISILGAVAHNLVDYNFNFAVNLIIFWVILALLNSSPADNLIRNDLKSRFFSNLIIIFVFVSTTVLVFAECRAVYYSSMENNEKYRDLTSYPRYIFFLEADKYIANGDLVNAELMYQNYIKQNKFDSACYNRLGEFYRDKFKNHEKALFYFQLAIDYDSKNFWIYYLNYLNSLIALDKYQEIADFSVNIKAEIENYMPKLKDNLHYTANTGNPNDLIEILEILQKIDPEQRTFYSTTIANIKDYLDKYKIK